MTYKDKAIELVNKFKSNVYKKAFADTDFMYDRYYGLDDEMAKQCALIHVNEQLNLTWYMKNDRQKYDWEFEWTEVKQEIEKL
jgi:hypothetical protein